MKKVIIVLLSLLCLVACSGTKTDGEKGTEIKENDKGEKVLPIAMLQSYVETVEVTTDNWKDYFMAKEGETVFGDGSVYYDLDIVSKENCFDYDVYMKLHDNVNDEDIIFDNGYNVNKGNKEDPYTYYGDKKGDFVEFVFENFDCTEANGIVYKASIPEEYIYCDDEDEGNYVNFYYIDEDGNEWPCTTSIISGYDFNYIMEGYNFG